VEEILRMPTPLPNISRPVPVGPTRYAHADIDIGGVTISAGDLVLLNARAANCDREVFTDPERFDIARMDNPRACTIPGVWSGNWIMSGRRWFQDLQLRAARQRRTEPHGRIGKKAQAVADRYRSWAIKSTVR
jgi:cytochrome P450